MSETGSSPRRWLYATAALAMLLVAAAAIGVAVTAANSAASANRALAEELQRQNDAQEKDREEAERQEREAEAEAVAAAEARGEREAALDERVQAAWQEFQRASWPLVSSQDQERVCAILASYDAELKEWTRRAGNPAEAPPLPVMDPDERAYTEAVYRQMDSSWKPPSLDSVGFDGVPGVETFTEASCGLSTLYNLQ